MIRKCIFVLLSFLTISPLFTQAKKIAFYNFKNCNLTDSNGNYPDLNSEFPPECKCGTVEDAIDLNMNSFNMSNTYDSLFRFNFTLCFDVLIENPIGDVNLISKSAICNSDTALDISYRVSDSVFVFFLKEGTDEVYTFFADADPKSCWQNVCLSVNGIDIRAYINGKEKASIIANDLLRLDNGSSIGFNNSDCQNNGLVALQGRIDRVLFANYAFLREDVEASFIPQQRILTQDTIIFLGDQFELRASSVCPSLLAWTPGIGLSSTSILNPICNPTSDILYSASFRLGRCSIQDSVLVRVVDKDKLECNEIRLPTAFTPNGDNLNDEFFISNPYIISELESFEIFDRNGGVVFRAKETSSHWDGKYKNKDLNSGTYFYRIEYTCKNESYKSRGSVMLMR
ncbi:MAG: gliding motility-associated C-terminal domain-containing protein [Saprospiraceae bacterium]|nr:gliding motility-associated C-terminal domain-containing protein [Saprospiraceae bacterium]